MPGDVFDLTLPADTPLRRAVSTAARPLLGWMLGLGTFRRLRSCMNPGVPFARSSLDVLRVRTDTCETDLDRVPAGGPLIVAANHPHGALDGLLLLDLVGRIRSDVRLLANHVLTRVPELRHVCFFVDPFERPGATERSLSGLRAAHLWLRRGGALVAFPAGEVAHTHRPDGSVADSPWRDTIGRLAVATGARVLPVRIDGGNSRLFYAAGRIHAVLRTALLPRELLKVRGRTVSLRLGPVLSPAELESPSPRPNAVTQRIRQAVEQAGAAGGPVGTAVAEARSSVADAAALHADVAALPASALLGSAGRLHVYCAEAAQIPVVLQEIGRLREVTYRAVGEGTGQSSDLDRFDARYLHLFVWNEARREVVGAYRMGRTDLIVASDDVDGLYTRTLFRYERALVDRLSPALELGRSFVRGEYQRNPNALLLLWKGICAFIARHPQYRVLFGAVSVSARYSDTTRNLLMAFLEQNHLEDSLRQLVEAINPCRIAAPRVASATPVPATVEDLESLVRALEHDRRGMPVLLRQYLKLNARLLGFNVDPAFGDALDALMMVDLTAVDPRMLRRYFGAAEAKAFLDYHASRSAHAA